MRCLYSTPALVLALAFSFSCGAAHDQRPAMRAAPDCTQLRSEHDARIAKERAAMEVFADSLDERQLLTACSTVSILLSENAKSRTLLAVDFAGALTGRVVQELLSSDGPLTPEAATSAARELKRLMDSIMGRRPNFVLLVNHQNQIVGKIGLEADFPSSMARDSMLKRTLNGRAGDSIWTIDETLYRVAAAPIRTREPNRVSAVILGHAINNKLAKRIVGNAFGNLNFYGGGGNLLASNNEVDMHDEIKSSRERATKTEDLVDCGYDQVSRVEKGGVSYLMVTSSLPAPDRAFYSVSVESSRPRW